MNTSRLIENLYQVSIHGIMSAEDEKRLVWMQEFLSMFDFLWNHVIQHIEGLVLIETRFLYFKHIAYSTKVFIFLL